MSPSSSGPKNTPCSATCFHAGFLLGLFYDPEDGGDDVLSKRRFTFKRLHGIISQKIELFIITAVRTSNLTVMILPVEL
jgi:hypothetical protein